MERFLVFNFPELIAAGGVIVLLIVQLSYYAISYNRPYKKMKMRAADKNREAETTPPVSVIVYTRNESYNLKKYLPSLLSQDYPSYEVIVINDGSTDESDDVLKLFEHDYKHLYHTFIPQESKYLSRRKLSLTLGIKAAKNDVLLFTEADCRPISKDWIRAMAQNYTSDTNLVLGFCAYTEGIGFLHKLISYDNLINGLEYLSSALKNNPFGGNGKNLSYRRRLFFEHKGFSKSLSLHAGDDDLFVNETADSLNTQVEYSKRSITKMAPVERFVIWKNMKISRAATQRRYKGRQSLFYRMEKAASLLFLLAVSASIVLGLAGNLVVSGIALASYIVLFTTKAVVLKRSAAMLQQKMSIALLPLLEIIQPLFDLYIYVYRVFRGKKDYTFTISNK
ncbi:MAG: glycosyltransferase [Tannerellaceae bacterium]|jgi:cellulose synthase/poly-beta-1,6-N-acetylglucosamine synthase-like glycosyltransferase|nr:glycosyltransferase [Tannerellaceae bacterium]